MSIYLPNAFKMYIPHRVNSLYTGRTDVSVFETNLTSCVQRVQLRFICWKYVRKHQISVFR